MQVTVFPEPDYVLHAQAYPNDTYFSYLWGLDNTGTVPFDTNASRADADIEHAQRTGRIAHIFGLEAATMIVAGPLIAFLGNAGSLLSRDLLDDAVQRYQDEPWPQLVALWRLYNLHLAHVMP